MEVKNVIKNRRLEKGLTMKEVANAVGVSEGAVSRWESGDINNMRRDRIYRLSQVLDISPLLILGIEQPSEEEKQNNRILEYAKRLGRLTEEEVEDVMQYADFVASKRKK